MLVNEFKNEKLYNVLMYGLMGFVFVHFFIFSYEAFRIAMLGVFLPLSIWTLLRNKAHDLYALIDDKLFKMVILFFGYAFFQSLYCNYAYDVSAKPLLNCVVAFFFVAGIITLFKNLPLPKLRLFIYFVLLCTLISGIIALARYAHLSLQAKTLLRLTGLGFNENSNFGGYVFIQYGLAALALLLKSDKTPVLPRYSKAFLISTICIAALYILFIQGKGVMITLALSLIIMLFMFGYKKIAMIITLGVAAAFTFLFSVFVKPVENSVNLFRRLPFGDALLERGDSYRLGIWEMAIDLIQKQPILGYGLGADFPNRFEHPHSMYLSAAFYLGLIGFMLFMTLILYTVQQRKLSLMPLYEKIFYIQFWVVLFAGLTELNKTILGASYIWMILWVPFAIYHGLRMRESPLPAIER